MGFVLQDKISVTLRLICLEINYLLLLVIQWPLSERWLLRRSRQIPAAGRWTQVEMERKVTSGYRVSPGQPGLSETYLKKPN